MGSSSSSAAVDRSSVSVNSIAVPIEPEMVIRMDSSAPLPDIPRTSSQHHKLRPDSFGERVRRVSTRSKGSSSDKDTRTRHTSQSRRDTAIREQEERARKAEELEKVIMMANAIETIRQKSQAKAIKESKTDCRVM
jgi:hypothetical protein